MRGAWTLGLKDMRSYFLSWVGMLIFVFFFLLAGIFITLLVLGYAKISVDASQEAYQGVQGLGLTRFVMGSFFLNLASLLIFLAPLITMRSFAEERKHETLELLFTYPLSDFDILFGKFIGVMGFLKLLVFPTLGYIAVIYGLGGRVDWGPVLCGYLGFLLLGGAYMALGLFISSISESPLVSAIVTFSLLIIFWIFEWVVGVTDGFWAHFFAALSPLTHYRDFSLGILDLSHITYFLLFQLYFLFLALRAIETRNWKG